MAEEEQNSLPTQIVGALATIPKALVPSCLKALDRLVGATIDIPVAWLAQKKAKIETQTEAYRLVEVAIAKRAASLAEADPETVERAAQVLIRKAYRKQVNRENVAAAALEDLSRQRNEQSGVSEPPPSQTHPDVDEDWLNVFERYAEDASTERMQRLWGRVLAGEIRKPGRYSMRTLRFLSEFSQADGLIFADFATSALGDIAPTKLVKPHTKTDIRDLLSLESAGLIEGGTGPGLSYTLTFNADGNAFLREGDLAIWLQGEPGTSVDFRVVVLTPLGQELLSLLPGRDRLASARKVANSFRSHQMKSAYLGRVDDTERVFPMEVLWQNEEPGVVEATKSKAISDDE
jgi:hypothetical protein